MTTSTLPACKAGIKPSQAIFSTLTSRPIFLPIAFIRSISKPTILPFSSINSKGEKSGLVATFNTFFSSFAAGLSLPQPATANTTKLNATAIHFFILFSPYFLITYKLIPTKLMSLINYLLTGLPNHFS